MVSAEYVCECEQAHRADGTLCPALCGAAATAATQFVCLQLHPQILPKAPASCECILLRLSLSVVLGILCPVFVVVLENIKMLNR